MEPQNSVFLERNRDVEHIVNAATNLGHYKFGQQVDKHFAMLVMSDVHRSYQQMTNMVTYLNYKEGIDVGISLGDHMGSDFTESDSMWYINDVLSSKKRIFTVIGNHDAGNSTCAGKSGTTEQVFEKYLLPLREHMGLPELDKTYYAVNFDEYKITLIVLNNYMTPDVRDENGDFKYNRGLSCLDQAEVDWLIETLNDVPKDYHVIIARHDYPDDPIKTPCAWTQETFGIYVHESAYGKSNLVPDIVHAWMNGTALVCEYAPLSKHEGLPVLKVDADFTARGKGIFVTYLIGHVHRDHRGTANPYTDQTILTFPCSGTDTWSNADSDLPRLENTKAEDCLTVLAVDTDNRRINMVRIGANITNTMVDRTFTTFHY